ncbi:hypothetical protein E3P99_00468 [Wallemia hederae]|uniref:SAC3/GANP/THP3 conserved domain-containing protein n=1 Tax=Wallemia hederae TaxID=1540922 RepID=A0A4T0FUZ3_9BASI|nr:hypothetical protein E3P99_00468 [Wallemia hederae]
MISRSVQQHARRNIPRNIPRSPRLSYGPFYRHASTSQSIRQRLQQISQRTGTDPVSLSASFAILHEITAIVPIFVIFGGLHWMGVGEHSLEWIWGSGNQADGTDGTDGTDGADTQGSQSAIQEWLRGACEEGERRLDRVRLRYNLWQDETAQWDGNGKYTAQISEAIAAYALTKVLLPVRIFASLYYAPRFSIYVFEPLKRLLRAEREVERLAAIRDGLIPDPTQGMSLSDAITLRGTCESMCPEFERVEREYQLSLDKYEAITDEQGKPTRFADAARTVKTFHRPAAGDEASLPSDVRPPAVLRMTLDYLFHTILARDTDLHDSHHFVRDRTRSIRQDFTLQHIRNDVAIECHERIARYHILCLHELCDRTGWSDQQEIEQLSKVLLSLTEFYDDWRSATGEILPNEAEFRAYHLLIHLRDSSTAAAAERLPMELYLSQPIQLALKFHALARRSNEALLRGRPHNTVSSPNAYSRFFKLIQSSKTPFLMACLLETSFSQIRRGAFKAMRIAYPSKYRPFPVADLVKVLGCDDGEQVAREAENLSLEVERDPTTSAPLAVKVNKQAQVNDAGPTLPHAKSALVTAKRGSMSAQEVIDTPLAGKVHSKLSTTLPTPSTSSLRPTAPAFTMPGVAANKAKDPKSPSSLMPPPAKPSTNAFSSAFSNAFQPKGGAQTNAFSFGKGVESGAGTGAGTGAFGSAFSAQPIASVTTSAPTPNPPSSTSSTETDIKQRLQQQQDAKREREERERAKAKAEADAEAVRQKEAERRAQEAVQQQTQAAMNAEKERRRLSDHRRQEERMRLHREHEKLKEKERREKREREQLIQTMAQSLTARLLHDTVASVLREYALDGVAAAFRSRALSSAAFRHWRRVASTRIIRKEMERERREEFREAVQGLSFTRSARVPTPTFTLPIHDDSESESEEELFDHEDEEVAGAVAATPQITPHNRLSDVEMQQKLQEQKSALWESGGALHAVAEVARHHHILSHYEKVVVGLYTHDDSASSSHWLRTRFGVLDADHVAYDSHLTLYVNDEQPSPSTAIIFFETSPNLARNLTDSERLRTLNDDKKRLERLLERHARSRCTFVPTVVVLSWCDVSVVESTIAPQHRSRYLQIAPQAFDAQLRTLLDGVSVQVKEYATTSLQKLAQTFAPITLASIHKLHQMAGVDSGTHLHTAMLNASISLLNVLIRATNKAVKLLCDDDAQVTHVAQLPLLKSKEGTPLQTALIEWLDDARFDFESEVLLLRAEIAGWSDEQTDRAATVYVLTRILSIVYSNAIDDIVLNDDVSLDEEGLVEQTDFVRRTRSVVMDYERMVDRVRSSQEQRHRQRKRDEEVLKPSLSPSLSHPLPRSSTHSDSSAPSPLKKKAVNSGALKDLISSVRSSLFAK